jgi:hypothetical protein
MYREYRLIPDKDALLLFLDGDALDPLNVLLETMHVA